MDKGRVESAAIALAGRMKEVVAKFVRDEAARAVDHFRQARHKARERGEEWKRSALDAKDRAERAARSAAGRVAQGAQASQAPQASQASQASQTAEKPAAAPKRAPAAPEAGKPDLLDLNTASQEDLLALDGIGPARAQAIIAGRPYAEPGDLAERKIIPANVYVAISPKLTAKAQ